MKKKRKFFNKIIAIYRYVRLTFKSKPPYEIWRCTGCGNFFKPNYTPRVKEIWTQGVEDKTVLRGILKKPNGCWCLPIKSIQCDDKGEIRSIEWLVNNIKQEWIETETL